MTDDYEGTFCLVLHSHLPWLPHHGTWPVGEEWLYQAWAHSYLPMVDLLERFAAEGRRDVLTLGMTPVLAAQLDDPYSIRACHDWLGHWQLRAQHASTLWRDDPILRELAAAEHRTAVRAAEELGTRWRHGFSPILRSLVDNSTIEVLGGPLAHPFQPLLEPRVREFALNAGLADTALRIGSRPEGIWAPECGYAPGLENDYAAAGVRRFMVDGPSLRGETWAARPVGDSDVLAFGRDLEVTYRVWSPKAGYPGHAAYRDFHTWAHEVGLKASRVTGKTVEPADKAPYDPALAADVLGLHVKDFVDTVVTRLRSLKAQQGRESLVVAAYDTELFGHWWHEGPAWLEGVLRALPEAGVRVTTLKGALEAGHVGPPIDLPASSWGSGKDWRVWDGEQVKDMVEANTALQERLLDLVAGLDTTARDTVADQAVAEAMLALESDWAFMVTKDSAADYARRRAAVHTERFDALAGAVRRGDRARGEELAAAYRADDGPFGHLDARALKHK
ncbi:glycoside hydrolase family 57 protein [Amycolatopsis sp. WQ 127309]|uniref:1,4-alpha-glucan branching protein domain-containing protein n=1 Tax=Amycolatopsis sp. WQ 127309 TaxID=2932773 RepID=UPI001FF14635|nr:glycoside hydrolase family 57 protein [Amycolatopsis sp. WQ 127309]UOZ10607.1 glycoside hydrolase family 57 protein [Amycolatopsis sp. WQ 127309]